MAKTKIHPFWIVLAFLIAAQQMGFLGSVLPDYGVPYDNFDTFNANLWTVSLGENSGAADNSYAVNPTSLISASNGVLKMSVANVDKPTSPSSPDTIGRVTAKITSTRKFGTDDIKILVSSASTTTGYCSADGASYYDLNICYGSWCTNPQTAPGSTQTNLGGGCTKTEKTTPTIYEIKRYDDLDLTKFVVLVDGKETVTGTNAQPEPIIIKGGTISLDSVSWEPYYSCIINYSHQVVVRDTFNAGSTVNNNKLTYAMQQFCPKDLGVLRLTENGLTDEIGSITESISKGQTVQVPSGEVWQIDYITEYVSNMKERCGLGQAYDTTLQKCVQIAVQKIATQTLLYCTKDADCVIPQKCTDATVSCVSNQCDYKSAVCTPEQIINYLTVIREVTVPQVKIISTGTNEVSFKISSGATQPTVAGKTFTSTKPALVCSKSVWGPIIDDNCYQTTFSWAGYSQAIKNGQTISLTPNIDLRFIYSGTPARMLENSTNPNLLILDKSMTNWENTFVVTFKNVYDITLVSIPEKVKLGTAATLQYKIKNNIFPIATKQQYLIKKLATNTFESPIVTTTLSTGENTVTYTLPSNQLGNVIGEMTPTFDMYNGIAYVPDERLFFGVYVTDDTNTLDCTKSGYCNAGVCQTDGSCLITQQPNCNLVPCKDGTCDTGSGNCVVTQIKTVTVTINQTVYKYINNTIVIERNVTVDNDTPAEDEEDEEGFKMDNNMITMIIIGVFALALIGGGRRR